MFGYPDPSRRFTMGLGSIVYDVLDDYIVHASFQRYLASERSAALEHLYRIFCVPDTSHASDKVNLTPKLIRFNH